MAHLLTLFFVLLLANPLLAVDLGVHGELFPVVEENLLDWIKSQASELPQEFQDQVVSAIKRPRDFMHLPNATENRTVQFDPSITLKQEILDASGKVLYPKGHRFNPLTVTQLSQALLFFDGTKENHLDWACKEAKDAKWILVSGSPLDLSEKERREVFFDQGGGLVRELGIQALPAKVSQQGMHLLVEEVALKEEP